MALFRKTRYSQVGTREIKNVPKNIASKCPACKHVHIDKDLSQKLKVCDRCGHHFSLPAKQRLKQIVDEGTFREINRELISLDPLDFPGYGEKLEQVREKSGLNEAVITGFGKISGIEVGLGIMAPDFMLGSMGSVVGEKITRLVDKARELKKPLIIFSASGGARMQESIYSLMQMAKTSNALARFSDAGLLYISVLTHPTTGGVTASFAMLGDINIAEPGSLIGFAGPRVIQQTIGQQLPEGFQRAEFLLEHGFIDRIVERKKMKKELTLLLQLHQGGEKIG